MKIKKWILFAIPLAMMLIVFFPVADQASDAAPVPISYIDENSDTPQTVNAEYVLNAVGNQLTTGYWYASGYISRGALTVNGDAVLILEDDCTFFVTGTGITVPAGSSLTIYPQSRGADMGKINTRITLTGGSVKNVASIEYTTNVITVSSGGPVTNYGKIVAPNNTGVAVYSTAAVEVNNNSTAFATGFIASGFNRVSVGAGSTVNNSGSIVNYGTNTSGTSVISTGSITVINHADGYIEARGMCVYVGAGSTVTNEGLIEGMSPLYAVNSALINETGGIIRSVEYGYGYGYGVQFDGSLGNSIMNRGLITSPGTCVYVGNNTKCTIENHGNISGGVVGIVTGSGTSNILVDNYSLIEGSGGGISLLNGTINNYGTIAARTSSGGICISITSTSAVAAVNNHGTLSATTTGTGECLSIRSEASGVTVSNDVGCTIQGSMELNRGGTVTNCGTINGNIKTYNFLPIVLVNNKVINGDIVLTNAANDVTFKAGSTINGNFYLGTGNTHLRFTGTPDSSLTYAKITGSTADIGNSRATIHIDGAVLPPLTSSSVLTLIKIHDTGAVITAPLNSSGTFGGFDFQILVENHDLIAKVLVVNYAKMVTNTDTGSFLGASSPHTFPSAVIGYGAQTPLDVTVTNTGINATGHLSVTISGADASLFDISKTSISSLGVAAYDTFLVTPRAGSPAGTHTAIITIGPAAGNLNPIGFSSFEISFTVTSVSTITTVTSSLNPSMFGQSVTFTATVTSGAGTPTGSVIIYENGAPMGTFPLDASGTARYTTDALGVGSHIITAEYLGSAAFDASVSAGLVQIVNTTVSKTFRITATSDIGSRIFPRGVVIVPQGANETFRFWAADGYAITAVIVDGVALTHDEIELGQYTFRNVQKNHTIEVRSAIEMILEITVHGGSGHAEYNLNERGYSKYVRIVMLPNHSFISLVAVADDGYEFKEWRKGSEVFSTPNISFDNVTKTLKLDLYFTDEAPGGIGPGDDGFPWWIVWAAAALMMLGLFLLWFLFYYRRVYDVIKVESPVLTIIGDDRIRRKKTYRFKVEGKPTGSIYYRIGYEEDAEWKIASFDKNNEYTVPGKEVVSDITIEDR